MTITFATICTSKLDPEKEMYITQFKVESTWPINIFAAHVHAHGLGRSSPLNSSRADTCDAMRSKIGAYPADSIQPLPPKYCCSSRPDQVHNPQGKTSGSLAMQYNKGSTFWWFGLHLLFACCWWCSVLDLAFLLAASSMSYQSKCHFIFKKKEIKRLCSSSSDVHKINKI